MGVVVRRVVLAALAMLTLGAAPPRQDIPHCHMIGPFVLFFERGSNALDRRSREVLDRTTDIVTNDQCFDEAKMLISGHTDKGERDALALRRATAAREYLVARGVAANRITVEPLGSRVPRTYGKSRAENQRAEISLGY